MRVDGKCEALGAWPATVSHDLSLREHLRERGVERLDALLGDETLPRVMGIPVAMQPLNESGIVANALAGKLRANIESAASRASPFANVHWACACVDRVLEEAALARQRRSVRKHWRAEGLQTSAPGAEA